MVKKKSFELPHCAGVAFDILPNVVVRTIIHYHLLCICALVHLSLCAPSSTKSSYAFVLWCICRCAHYHPLPALMQGLEDVTTLYTMK